MLSIYFSGTGNTKHIAQIFSQKMNAECLSVEDSIDFSAMLKAYETLVFCYPIYHSRVPLIMRKFVQKHMAYIQGKNIIILVTQQAFSGDGARVFTDLFAKGAINVIYAEHFNMQQNMGNIPIWSSLFKPSDKSNKRYIKKTEAKMNIVCSNVKNNIVKKRGFNKLSKILGYIQGKPWQKNTSEITPARLEKRLMKGVRIHDHCNVCNLCVAICPMKNLACKDDKITHLNNCTVCYRCVNRCPKKAITVYIHRKPKWQYSGMDT